MGENVVVDSFDGVGNRVAVVGNMVAVVGNRVVVVFVGVSPLVETAEGDSVSEVSSLAFGAAVEVGVGVLVEMEEGDSVSESLPFGTSVKMTFGAVFVSSLLSRYPKVGNWLMVDGDGYNKLSSSKDGTPAGPIV